MRDGRLSQQPSWTGSSVGGRTSFHRSSAGKMMSLPRPISMRPGFELNIMEPDISSIGLLFITHFIPSSLTAPIRYYLKKCLLS